VTTVLHPPSSSRTHDQAAPTSHKTEAVDPVEAPNIDDHPGPSVPRRSLRSYAQCVLGVADLGL
jgi:hypothetical protein